MPEEGGAFPLAELNPPVRLQMSEVQEHPDNPRVHSVSQINELKASLLEHGFVAGSMVVQRSTMRLVKGHGIYKALLELGCEFADFLMADMTDEAALVFLMLDNRLSDLSSWHTSQFHTNVQTLKAMNVEVKRIGFTMKQIEAMKPKDVDIDPNALDDDGIGTGTTKVIHVCPKCGHKFGSEAK